MNCGDCRHDNEPNAKFCSECGAPLTLHCPTCEAEQTPGSKFCNQCGSRLRPDTTPAPSTPAPPAAVSAVRKNVTALFADLVGSTSFGERVDPEAARAALAPYFDILRSTIEDHAGTVAKFTGDGVMAIFGVPEIAEDDALRAVAAGVEMQRRFRVFAETVRDRHGVELGMRVGINTGELVVDDGDEDIVGDVLNTAARLEAACQPGRVMVGEDTWRLTRSTISYEVLGEVRVKGKADALATFQVADTGAKTVNENIPFVGRAHELATVRDVFESAVASTSCRLATVIGAPGVGKTRLASELRSGITARSFDLRFERRGSTTFTPIVDLLRELTGSGSAEDVAHLVADHVEADRLGTILASLLGEGPARSTEESFWAVRRLLEHLARDEPLLVVVDDIQWAEPLFWDLLDHLAEWTAAPVMLLGLARPELRELRPLLTETGGRVASSIRLEGLDAATSQELAARLLDTDELPVDLVERIPESTEGNPLFIRELVQMLVDDGVLAQNGDRWHLTIDVDAIEVPPTILSLLASRVERLPEDERQVVELASVIGTEFDRGLLGAIAGDRIANHLGALIDRLRRKDLVEPSGAWVGDDPVYRFHHVLVRDAAYRRLLKGHRAELHERVGRHLEADDAAGDENDVVVAFHYEQVHRYRSELGTLDDDTRALARQATSRLRRAAELALSREDLASSGSYAIRALALTDQHAERDELLVLGCEALLSSGDVARAVPLVEELLDRDLDERLTAWADCFRAQLWSLTDSARLSEATDLAADAAARLDALGDSAGVAKARLVRASTLARLGRVGDCEAELDLALGAARAAGDRRRTVAVLGAAPLAALWGPSPVARAGGRCLDVLRLLRITTSSPAVEATSIRCQGMLEAMRGRLDSAHDKFETSRTTARDLGIRHGLYETELFEGFVDLVAGDPVAAEPHLILARDGLGTLGIGADAGFATALLARALLRQGRLHEADELAADALRSAGENLQTAVASRSVLGEIRAAQGRADEARRLIVEALEIVDGTDITIDHAIARRSAARVAERLGDADGAREHLTAAARLLAEKGVTGLGDASTEQSDVASPEQDDPASDTVAQRTAHLPLNAAWEVNEGLWSTWIAGDREAYVRLLAPDFQARIHELGPKLAFSGDREATAEVLFGSLADDRPKAIPNRLLAVRGDELALIAMTFQDGSSTTTMYTVSQVRDGQAVRADTFAEDQLGDALDELDRRWVALGAPADPIDRLARLRRVSAAGDYEQMRGLLDDDFEAVSHGQLMLVDRRTADDYIESIRPLFGDGGVVTSILADIPAVRAGVALTQFHLDMPDGGGWRLWYVWCWESGRLTRADIYPLDAPDEARARFEELAAANSRLAGDRSPDRSRPTDISLGEPEELDARTISNTAWIISRQGIEALDRWDREAFVALLSEHLETVDHERFSLAHGVTRNRDEYVAVVFDRHDLLAGSTTTGRPVAIRGDDLCLITTTRATDGYTIERLVVIETRDAKLVHFDWFDVDDLVGALDELDRRWLDSLGYGAEHWLTAAWPALYASDPNELEPALHPDWEFVDHRPLGYPDTDTAGFIRYMASREHQQLVIVPRVHRISDHGVVAERIEAAVDEIGEVHVVLVGQFRDHLTIRTDAYDLDDLDAALARYDEIARAAHPVPRTPTNAATRLIEEHTAALNDGDLDRFLAAFHPEVRQELHQRLQVTEEIDLSGVEALGRSVIAGQGVLTSEPVAVFGDRLAVCVQVLRFGPDEIRECSVVEVDDGVITRVARFDDDQLIDALDTFDRRSAELGWPPALAETEILIRRAHWNADLHDFAATLAPSWEFHDHRRLGLGRMSRAEYMDSSFPVRAGEVLYWTVEVLAHTDEVWLAHDRWRTADGSGWDQLHVGVLRGGTARSSDTFDLNDLDAARAHYDGLVAAGRSHVRRQPANLATRLNGRLVSAFTDGDRERFTGLLADDFASVTHEHLQISGDQLPDRESFVQQIFDVADLSEHVESDVTVIAVRDDDLCLARIDTRLDDGNLDRYVVVQATGDRIGATEWFDIDDLMAALDVLDRRWVALGGPDRLAEHTVALRRAIHEGDTEAARSVLSPGFRATDHRRLGLPTLDREAYLGAPKGGSGTELVVVDVVRHSSRASMEHIQVRLEDGWSTMEMWAVISLDEHGIVTMDNYDIDDVDAAHARFEDLTPTDLTTADLTSDGSRTFSNRAWEVARAMIAAHDASDRARCASRLADDMVFVAHDPIMQFAGAAGEVDREAWLDVVFHGDFVGEDHASTDELIATRGDRLCLGLVTATAPNGDVTDRLYLTEIDGHGRCVRIDSYRTEQLRDAYDELDRRYLLSLPLRDLDTAARNRGAWYASDPEGIAPILHPRFRFRDHRKLAWPDADRDAMLEYADTLPAGSSATVPEIFRVTDHDFVVRRVQFMDEGTASTDSILVGRVEDGLLIEMDWYEPADLDAALARYEELTSTSPPDIGDTVR